MPSEETPETSLIIEQTDSGENHFVFRDIERRLDAICEELAGIHSILLAGHNASEATRAEAQAILDAHAESAQQYMHGGRLFTLADGVIIRVSPAGVLATIGIDGVAAELEPAKGGIVTLPDGRELTLKPEAVYVTHEAAGIEGLPLDIDPVQTSEDRYRIELPDGYRLDVSHGDRTALIGNPVGIVDVLSIIRIEGIGEKVTVRLVPGGAKGFSTHESGHKGIIEADGTIHLSMANGLDLVIRFPDGIDADGDDDQDNQSKIICEECD